MNFVACSIGMSPGFAPLRILSTKVAARRNIGSKAARRSPASPPFAAKARPANRRAGRAVGPSAMIEGRVQRRTGCVSNHETADRPAGDRPTARVRNRSGSATLDRLGPRRRAALARDLHGVEQGTARKDRAREAAGRPLLLIEGATCFRSSSRFAISSTAKKVDSRDVAAGMSETVGQAHARRDRAPPPMTIGTVVCRAFAA